MSVFSIRLHTETNPFSRKDERAYVQRRMYLHTEMNSLLTEMNVSALYLASYLYSIS